MSTRLEQLQKMLQREPNDTFLLYGLAMEHKKASEFDRAIELLAKVTQLEPGHGYAFFQCGQIEELRSNLEAAKRAYSNGIVAAKLSNDDHAKSELEAALAMISE